MTGNRGIVLFMVLGSILVIVILASVILGNITNQSRITHHQVGRIQAFYAAQAGINYAREMIRLHPKPEDGWAPDVGQPAIAGRLCNVARGGCATPATNDVTDNSLPPNILSVNISIGAPGSGISGTRQIQATVDYAPVS